MDIIVIAAIVIIIGLAVGYIIKAKKRGVKCIGCSACDCGKCSGCGSMKSIEDK